MDDLQAVKSRRPDATFHRYFNQLPNDSSALFKLCMSPQDPHQALPHMAPIMHQDALTFDMATKPHVFGECVDNPNYPNPDRSATRGEIQTKRTAIKTLKKALITSEPFEFDAITIAQALSGQKSRPPVEDGILLAELKLRDRPELLSYMPHMVTRIVRTRAVPSAFKSIISIPTPKLGQNPVFPPS